ncbi:hypothetical protein [Streptomyces sp. NPDC007205]|uniref:NACHT domain-containing protein n=1 Tax=Streptomyces sp. NPDC007205 TaxID=3154316 RepID=UPI0033F7EB3C
MVAPPTGPVADFWIELRRLVEKSRVPQTEIASELGLSPASVSGLLGGERKKTPDWDVVQRIVSLCARRYGAKAPPPPGMSLDECWWKIRHAELERTVETAPAAARRSYPPPPAPPSPPSATARGLGVADCVDMGLDEAVFRLAGSRPELTDHADLLLGPLFGERDSPGIPDELLEGFPQRVRAAHGVDRSVLLQAARVVLVAVAVVKCGPKPVKVPKLIQNLANGAYPAHHYPWLGGRADPAFMSPLADPKDSDVTADMVQRINAHFLELATPLAASCPEFALTAGLPCAGLDEEADGQAGTGLADLGATLTHFAGRGARPAAGGVPLRGPIASLEAPGLQVPSLADGYVSTRFQLAGPFLRSPDGIASDKWWEQQPSHEAIERFLAAHLLSLSALLAPLVVLGHPGAGKSLLTKLLTSRLPANEFRPLRVELRHIPAEVDVQTQLEHALRQSTGRSMSWPDWSEAEPGALPVVLLDGFDELLQAGAQRLDDARQWGYLRDIERFQEREAQLGRPLIVIVTSRTVVADRAELTPNSQVLRLEPFGTPEMERWLSIWNTMNGTYLEQRGLRPLTAEVLRPHQELAAQPLLLLMLALYDAVSNALHQHQPGDEGISRTQLYDRLLKEFVRRQVAKERPLPPGEQAAAVDQELHRLSVIALGMFQRGAQALSGKDADQDLKALDDAWAGVESAASGLIFGRFFFVHESQAVVTEQRLRSYEFMHATFSEHLAARLIERALWQLSHSEDVDDGQLYALLSFAPLTDRAQLVDNLRDMLAVWPTELVHVKLPRLLAEVFRTAEWEPERRTDPGHVPVRVTRTYRNAVYEVNLLLIGVVAAGEVYASQFLGTDELTDVWRRHAMMWRSQLSEGSWDLFSTTIGLDRCWKSDPGAVGGRRQDLRIRAGTTPSADHDIGWMLDMPPSPAVQTIEQQLAPSSDPALNLLTQTTFLGERHAELLLHALYPLLRRMPNSLLVYQTDRAGHPRTAAQSLLALLTEQVHNRDRLAELYAMCFDTVAALPDDENSYLEAVSRQLLQDIPALPDPALASVLRQAHRCVSGGVRLTSTAQQNLVDCVYAAVRRHVPELASVLTELHETLVRHGHTDEGDVALRALLLLAQAGRSSSSWELSGLPTGDRAGEHLNEVLTHVDLTDLGARHPDVVISLLRTAADLGLDDWLAARAAELIQVLPARSFGLLRPSDLSFLRAALPPGTYDATFEEVERVWR